MFSRTRSYPLRYSLLYALSVYITNRKITVPFYSEHCALQLCGREGSRRLRVTNPNIQGGCVSDTAVWLTFTTRWRRSLSSKFTAYSLITQSGILRHSTFFYGSFTARVVTCSRCVRSQPHSSPDAFRLLFVCRLTSFNLGHTSPPATISRRSTAQRSRSRRLHIRSL